MLSTKRGAAEDLAPTALKLQKTDDEYAKPFEPALLSASRIQSTCTPLVNRLLLL